MGVAMGVIRKAVQSLVPRSVGEATYSSAVKAFQLAVEVNLSDAHAQIWTRNGYRLVGWQPFESPVDLSVWFAREPSPRDLATVVKNYGRVKLLFPVLGQINLYVATEAEILSALLNPFDLERDPSLKKKLLLRNVLSARALGAAFLFRMLDSEIKEVLNPSLRTERRWGGYFMSIGSVFESDEAFKNWLNLEEGTYLKKILKLIVELVSQGTPLEERSELLACLELYYQSIGRDVPLETLRPLIHSHPRLWAIFPHRFCFESVKPHRLEGALSGVWAELAAAEICWELGRILGQSRFMLDEILKATARSHLDSMEDFSVTYLHSSLSAEGGAGSLLQTIDSVIGRIRKLL